MDEPEQFWQPDFKINYNFAAKHQLIGHWGPYDSDLLEWRIANQPGIAELSRIREGEESAYRSSGDLDDFEHNGE